jgi:non-heme chloroperoxidase
VAAWWIQRVFFVAAGVAAGGLMTLAAAVAFSSPRQLSPANAPAPAPPDFPLAWVPTLNIVTARDGAPLAYRLYPGQEGRIVVLIHGSTGTSYDVHDEAETLRRAGATVYSLDLRGHGGSGTRNGDVSYVGQLDDDLKDFLQATGLQGPGTHLTLAGFSVGGGFALRIASGPNRDLFDSYLALTPFIPRDTALWPSSGNAWVAIAKPRILALRTLEWLGLPWFQDLVVARYARPCQPDARCSPAYTYRMRMSLHVHGTWPEAAARINRPTTIVALPDDEVSPVHPRARKMATANPQVVIMAVDGVQHFALVQDARGQKVVTDAWRAIAGD